MTGKEYKRAPLLFSHHPLLCVIGFVGSNLCGNYSILATNLAMLFFGNFWLLLLFFKFAKSLWIPCILSVCSANFPKLELGVFVYLTVLLEVVCVYL